MWKVSFVGNSDAIRRALDTHGQTLTGPDRAGYNKARRILEQLVELNGETGGIFILTAVGNGEMAGEVLQSLLFMPSNSIHVQ
jgi:hypothetical protein